MAQFTIGKHTYILSEKLNLLESTNLARRLGPLMMQLLMAQTAARELARVTAAAEGDSSIAQEETKKSVRNVFDAFEPFLTAISKLADEDVLCILELSLFKVRRKEDGDRGWVDIWNTTAHRPQYEDTSPMEMWQVAIHVIKESVASFFSGGLSNFLG